MNARLKRQRDLDAARRFADFASDATRLHKRNHDAADAESPGIALLAQHCDRVERWFDPCTTPAQLLWRWHGFPTQHMADLLDAEPGLLVYCSDDDEALAKAICCGQAIGTVSGTAAQQADGTVRVVVWATSFAYDDNGVQLDLFAAPQ